MKSRQIALCGLLCGLAVVLMVLSGAIGVGTFLGPMLAMAALLPLLEEYGTKTAAAAYFAAALLGLLLVPEPELAMVYAVFGWYPLLRPHLDRIPSRILRLTIKAALCTAVILLLYGVLLRLFGMTADLLAATSAANFMLLCLGVITFLIMDLALARLTLLWRHRFRRRFFR